LLTRWATTQYGIEMILPRWPQAAVRGLFTLRTGGSSTAPFDSLNLGLHVADAPSKVMINRQRCASWLGGTVDDWVVPEQVHGNQVACVGQNERGFGSRTLATAVAGVDALVTADAGITLVALAADCVPILFFDAHKRVIAAAHSGWKGTVAHIASNVIEVMKAQYGCRPEEIDVWLGPAIRSCCYEVDDVVAVPVQHVFGKRYVQPRFNAPGKYMLGLQSLIRRDLAEMGVLPIHYHDVGLCTSCRFGSLFSHRAAHGQAGRLMGAVRLSTTNAR